MGPAKKEWPGMLVEAGAVNRETQAVDTDPFLTIDFQPSGTRLISAEPIVLRDAAVRAGVALRSVCGGKTTCGKCLVRVASASLSPITAAERLLLSEAELLAGYRQACRTVVSGDAAVYVPSSSLIEEQQVQVAGSEEAIEVDPVVAKYCLVVPPASLTDQRGDFDRTADALRDQHCIVLSYADSATLAQLSSSLREGNWTVTVVARQGELIAASPGDTTSVAVGLAVDLGTTKIACYLVDLLTGRTLAARGVMNPQLVVGEDVIARVEVAGRDQTIQTRLSQTVLKALDDAASDLCASAGIDRREILEVVVVGNTAMHHLAIGLPVRQLGVIPFVPVSARALNLKCAALGLAAAAGAYLHLPPLIAGFVGSDHVAVLLACRIGQDDGARLVVDLGTNTEIALQVGNRICSCSTACGPAFEGAHIKYGMRGAPGAIDRVQIDATTGVVRCTTVGGAPAVGLCGSGILDAVAELLEAGWLDGRGRLAADVAAVRKGRRGAPNEFVVADDRPSGGLVVSLTHRDLSEIKLAKGAIRAGIDILMDELSVQVEDIDEVIVAGAFGTYLDPRNAIRLGLFPPVPLSRLRQVGNAAGVGAKQVLLSRRLRLRAEQLAREVDYVELTLHPELAQRLAVAMRYGRRSKRERS